jgi:hydroxymethylglutaryl-CoA lyase
MGEAIRLHEVSLRDGLQNELEVVSTDEKLRVLEGLIACGFTDIEVTSFVRPRWVPQLADAAEVVARLPNVEGVRFWALVPNQRGLDRALESGIGHICTFLSASETHNRKNVNRTIRESLATLREVVHTAVAEDMQVRGYISTVFGCPYEGDVSVQRTLDMAHELLECGAKTVALGDTTGMGHPTQVQEVLATLVDGGIPLDRLAFHFHDTRGTALANVFAAWQLGARHFDGSISGVGGCPYAPGAAGNVCTQDLIHMFERMNAPTGVSLEAACQVGGVLEQVLDRPLPGRYHQYWQGQRRENMQVRSA